jgi:8-oxo-dGTP diphosphatase
MKKVTEVAAAVILREDGSFLLGQRAADTFYPGYWEFPGGKVESGETPREALIRELHEELAIEVVSATPWIVREHVYEHAHVRLHFFRVTAWRGELRDHVHAALSWQRPGELTVTPMLPANAPVLAALQLPAVYGITHAWQIGAAAQLAALDAALHGGLRLVQLRELAMPAPERRLFADAAVARCHAHGAQVLINHDRELVTTTTADGVHLSARQLMALHARPEAALVAASCHDRIELEHAAALELDFVVLGPVKPTTTHPGQPGIGWEKFGNLITSLPLPVYAIGGLTTEDIAAAVAHGAQGIAAIRGVWAADPEC